MTEGHHELTLKQILDSNWVRRLSRASMVVFPIVISTIGGAGSWVLYQNWQTSEKAVQASSEAAKIAAQALRVADDVRSKQDDRADLADTRAIDAKAWQQRLDEGLVRLNQRVSVQASEQNAKFDAVNAKLGDLLGDIGELKGLIVRQNASIGPSVAAPFPTWLLDGYTP